MKATEWRLLCASLLASSHATRWRGPLSYIKLDESSSVSAPAPPLPHIAQHPNLIMTRTARSVYPRAVNKDRLSKSGLDKVCGSARRLSHFQCAHQHPLVYAQG